MYKPALRLRNTNFERYFISGFYKTRCSATHTRQNRSKLWNKFGKCSRVRSDYVIHVTTIDATCFKPVFHQANFFARTSKTRIWLGGDVVSVCRQPIKLLFSLNMSPQFKTGLTIDQRVFSVLLESFPVTPFYFHCRQSLQSKENDTKKELHRVMQSLKAYKAIGMGFEELVHLYGDIIAEIDNKKWALTELRHNDNNDLNDLWKWFPGCIRKSTRYKASENLKL